MTVGVTTQQDVGGSVGAKPPQRFLALDSLRGVCALMVALFHFQSIGTIHATRFITHAYLFVEFFFVLSGFVIAASYGGRLRDGFPLAKFMALRLGRVYPLHLFMLAAFFVAELATQLLAPHLFNRVPFSGEYSIAQLLYGAAYVQIFFGTEETRWNGPSWSISAEVWTYVIWAVLFRLGGRKQLWLTALAATAVSFAVYYAMLRAGINAHHWGAVPRCMFSFGLGVFGFQCLPLVARELTPLRTRFWLATLVELAIIALVIAMVNANTSLLAPLLFTVVVLLFALEAGGVSRALITPPMLFLGMISYSIYMVHSFVEYRFVNLLTVLGHKLRLPLVDPGGIIGLSPRFADAMTIAMLIPVVLTATLTYYLIEKPGQRWSRKWVLERRDARTVKAEHEAPTF